LISKRNKRFLIMLCGAFTCYQDHLSQRHRYFTSCGGTANPF